MKPKINLSAVVKKAKKKYLAVEELAKFYCVSERTVWRWLKAEKKCQ